MKNILSGAIVDDGVILNILVFDNENTMREFNALPLAEGQGIGDEYLSPEEYADKKKVKQIVDAALSELNAV